MADSEFESIKQKVRGFAEERDWDQFHSPKNLAMALNVEAGELLEHFQWMSESQSQAPDVEQLSEIADEIADVQVYLIRLADKLNIDIPAAVTSKMVKNAQKYPADRVRGKSHKYSHYKIQQEE